MATVLGFMNWLLPLMYLVVWGLYLWQFFQERPATRRWSSRAAVVVVLVHVAVLALQSQTLGRLPMGTAAEFFAAMAVSLVATYLVIEKWLGAKSTGLLPTGLAFLFQLTASLFSSTVPLDNPFLRDPGFAGHTVLILLSYTALSLSFLYAILYLLQARQLGRKQFGLLFRRLPPLDSLERMSVGAVQLSVPLMFIGLSLGHLWLYDLADRLAPDQAARLSPYDPKILVSWVIFLVYTVGLIGHRLLGWRGRRMNVLAVSAYMVVMLAMGVVHHFVPSFHNFRTPRAALENPAPDSFPAVGADNGEVGS